jgi:hypothetical protein
MNPLLAHASEEQARLLKIIWEDYARRGQWPIYQYVEKLFNVDLPQPDANTVLLGLPHVRFTRSVGRYGWVWMTPSRPNPEPGDIVGLTVVGMSRIEAGVTEAEMFIRTLNVLERAERLLPPSPTEVQNVEVTSDELRKTVLPPQVGYQPYIERASRLGEILRHEPATWGFVPQSGDMTAWTATLTSRIRAYAEVENVEDYTERLVAEVAPALPEPAPLVVSSLALPEAIDYINALWLIRYGQSLFRVSRAESAARLTFDCQSAEDFNSQVSALAIVLDTLQLPGSVKTGKLNDLKTYLATQFSSQSMDRIDDAIDTLRNVFAVRATRQHSGAPQGVLAMRRLGGDLSSGDWPALWQLIQRRSVGALNAIREEVELLPDPET